MGSRMIDEFLAKVGYEEKATQKDTIEAICKESIFFNPN